MSDPHPEFGFKFTIGEDVLFAATVREAAAMNAALGEKKPWSRDGRPQRFTVQYRVIDECYGGVQRHYDLRAIVAAGSLDVTTVGVVGITTANGLLRASENELVSAADAP